MCDDFCLIHGFTLEYDFRSGFHICRECEKISLPETVSTTAETTDLSRIEHCRENG